jgi:hypothetical protein
MRKALRFLLALAVPGLAAWSADISGTWNFSVETDQGSGNPTFVLKQEGEKLTGAYTGLLGQANIAGSVKGDQVVIQFVVDAGGQTAKVVYSGVIEAPTRMKGKVQFGDLGSGTWTATKKS